MTTKCLDLTLLLLVFIVSLSVRPSESFGSLLQRNQICARSVSSTTRSPSGTHLQLRKELVLHGSNLDQETDGADKAAFEDNNSSSKARNSESLENCTNLTVATASESATSYETDQVELVSEDQFPVVPVQTLSSPDPVQRFRDALPRLRRGGDALDRQILGTAIPSMINLAVVPIVNSVDVFFVGRMGVALALAGQAAANQAFFTIFFLVAFLPTMTAPLVATAVGSGDNDSAQARVCESIFLCNMLGGLGTLLLVVFPRVGLSLVLPADAPAMEYASPYLRWRALSMIPALLSATGFAAYRGLLNTVTPLKVSLTTNAINLVLDPLLVFHTGAGYVGAAIATALAETTSGLIYLKLLLRRKLANWSRLMQIPSWKAVAPVLQGGAAMLARQAAINVGLVTAARRAQTMDPTGVAAAAYGIVMQMYAIGIVVHVAVQGTAAALVPATLSHSGRTAARQVADRTFVWGTLVGGILGVVQFLALPFLVPVFSTLPQVQQAVRVPALIASLIHLINGPVFAGEGVMLGLGSYRDLALVTAAGTATMVACITSPMGNHLEGILASIAIFCALQAFGVVMHHLRLGPLSQLGKNGRGLAAEPVQ